MKKGRIVITDTDGNPFEVVVTPHGAQFFPTDTAPILELSALRALFARIAGLLLDEPLGHALRDLRRRVIDIQVRLGVSERHHGIGAGYAASLDDITSAIDRLGAALGTRTLRRWRGRRRRSISVTQLPGEEIRSRLARCQRTSRNSLLRRTNNPDAPPDPSQPIERDTKKRHIK
ncbi:MAG TPA: hypothetical protein VGM88_02935 [Kofleriaceae bacterium]|jgi:hypothetical protein